jgi:hypothetical protein
MRLEVLVELLVLIFLAKPLARVSQRAHGGGAHWHKVKRTDGDVSRVIRMYRNRSKCIQMS